MNTKRSVTNSDCEKNEITKQCLKADHNFTWDQKRVVDRESTLSLKESKRNYTFFEESQKFLKGS